MGMAAHHLGADCLCHRLKIECIGLFGDACLKHNLQQQVPQLILQLIGIAALDGLRHFIGFLDGVGNDCLMGLL